MPLNTKKLAGKFDITIVSSWPRGLYLCTKFQKAGKKVCYIETPSESRQPDTLFLDESFQDQKSFLLSQGFLEKQKGGFSIISEQGVWNFQETETVESNHSTLQFYRQGKRNGEFKKTWLSFFAFNYKTRFFEYNNSLFSQKPLNLFLDHYLFKPSIEKKREFKENNPKIYWLDGTASHLEVKENKVFLNSHLHKSERVFFFNRPSYKKHTPFWQWDCFVFYGDLKDYVKIVPFHFVILNRIFLPWTHSNLLSVFRKDQEWCVWVRRSFYMNSDEIERLKEEILQHLQNLFKIPFRFVKRKKDKPGFVAYGEESFLDLKKEYPFFVQWQEDLGQQLQGEEEIIQCF